MLFYKHVEACMSETVESEGCVIALLHRT